MFIFGNTQTKNVYFGNSKVASIWNGANRVYVNAWNINYTQVLGTQNYTFLRYDGNIYNNASGSFEVKNGDSLFIACKSDNATISSDNNNVLMGASRGIRFAPSDTSQQYIKVTPQTPLTIAMQELSRATSETTTIYRGEATILRDGANADQFTYATVTVRPASLVANYYFGVKTSSGYTDPVSYDKKLYHTVPLVNETIYTDYIYKNLRYTAYGKNGIRLNGVSLGVTSIDFNIVSDNITITYTRTGNILSYQYYIDIAGDIEIL